MDDSKRDKIVEWFIFGLLTIFPFGQLIKVGIVNGLDVFAGVFLLLYLIFRPKRPVSHRFSRNFFWVALFSLALSVILFGSFGALYGGLYLLRLVAYYALFVLVWNLNDEIKAKLHSSLFIILGFVAVFGWLQYFFYPDLRALYEWGWDDHLYRLVGTFLDPTFTGIILTFGLLLTVVKLTFHPKGVNLKPPAGWSLTLVGLFLLISIVFTYSRASYLALLAGLCTILFLRKKIKVFLVTSLVFLVILFFLPKGVGEGEKLGRLSSVYAKLTNYRETIQIFEKSPVFGIGFNNICLAKQVYLKNIDITSHSCGGSDSSLLLVLATTGIVGFMMFVRLAYSFLKHIKINVYGISLLACFAALFIHSLFSNSLFYPWVLVFLAILGGEAYSK